MPEAKTKKSKRIFLFLRVAVVTGGIIWGMFWLSREQRWDNLVKIFLQMNVWVFSGALSVFVACQMVVGARWWLLLRAQSISIGFWAAVRLYFLGWFYNNFMPGSVGGDLLRAWYVTKHTDKKFEAVLSVFVDRVIGLLSTLTIAVFFYALFLRGKGKAVTFGSSGSLLNAISEYRWIIICVVVALATVFGGLLLYKRSRVILGRVWSYIYLYGARMIKKLTNAVVIYCRSPMTILAVFGLTVFLQITQITGFWILGQNMGIDVSVKYYYVFFTLTWVFGAVPVSIGGAVVVEGLLAYLFIEFAGVEPEAALAIALCQRVVWMFASLPGAAIHLLGAHLPKEFFIDYKEPIN